MTDLDLHAPNPTMLMAYALACPSLPLVVTHHSDVVRQRLLRYALGPFRRIVYTRAARILTTNTNYAGGSAELRLAHSNSRRCNGARGIQPAGSQFGFK